MKKIFYWMWVMIFIHACQNPQDKITGEKPDNPVDTTYTLTNPKLNSEAPYIFNNGRIITINWTQRDEHDSKINLLKFAFFNTNTMRCDSVITVGASRGLQVHLESMAKIGVKKDGTILAVYRKKPPTDHSRFGGLMYYVISTDNGRTWSDEHRLVDDTTSNSQSFYDMELLPDGNMGLTWLDSRSERRGKTLYFVRTDEQNIFSIQKPIAFSTCECCRTDLFADPLGRIHVAYRNLIEPDEEGFDGQGKVEIRDMYYLRSVDTAKTFSRPIPISRDNWHIYGCPHTGPSLAYNGQEIGALWFTAAHENPGLFFATQIDAQHFSPRKGISTEGRHPQMIGMNGKFYAVYESYYETDGKGYYKIVLDVILPDGRHKPYEISPPLTQNNHPVLTRVNKHKILVAWTNTDTRHPKIVYKVVDIRKYPFVSTGL